ncbi:MAG: DEAD/DEAH box helicase [Candidimonas sp.]|nr:MAG: DEAD/DEAH box helicase [Candidimonas sp.]
MYFNVSTQDGTPTPPYSAAFLNNHSGAASTPAATTQITVLKSVGALVNKRFFLDENLVVQKESYQQAFKFDVITAPINNIRDLYGIFRTYSATGQHLLIRGLPIAGLCQHAVQRLDVNFPEHPQGTPWVMLDFDDIQVPEGTDPRSVDAIEWIITRLPSEFHNVSYIYQHSSSAGILRADGTPMKSGLNAHIFFWFDRPIPGKKLAAYLRHHCLSTNFYLIGENRGGIAEIRYGIDPATIRSATQPHYISSPKIDAGVHCLLDQTQRQGLIIKATDEVTMAGIPEDIEATTKAMHDQVRTRYQREHGCVERISEVITKDGVSRKSYFVNPDRTARGGRQFLKGELNSDKTYFRLYFADEGTPGSWYVSVRSPQLARRFGDGETMALRELSEGAFLYVRDELGWFTEIPHQSLELTQQGYLPAITTFASAKVSLILSPTGSGKTYTAIEWIKAKKNEMSCVIYAAPTIALVNQMEADLRQAGLVPLNYQHVYRGFLDSGDVVVTTNKSLPKMLECLSCHCSGYCMIMDEVHAGLDYFMSSNKKNEFLELAWLKAKQTLLLTGTLTDVQRMKLPEVAKHALGSIAETHYCCYEFDPVRRNPLTVLPPARFDSDFIHLLETLAQRVKDSQPLPRVVMLLPTSKMKMYRRLLAQYGLTEYAEVVSRPESTEADIERARTSRRPILISSPLFALGLNFEYEPEILLVRFDTIAADTSQIIQTVNRANRGSVQCDVRIYGTVNKDAEFRFTSVPAIKAQIEAQFSAESSVPGLPDAHFQIDRVTYQTLRLIEKDSSTALSVLARENAIQNYNIVQAVDLPLVEKAKAKICKNSRKEARQDYRDAIRAQINHYRGHEAFQYFIWLDKLALERRENYLCGEPRIERDMENQRLGLAAGLCGLTDPSQPAKVSVGQVMRLFGEIIPWTSAQYAPEQHAQWQKVEAEKSEKLIVLVEKLQALRSREISAEDLSASLTRNKQLTDAFLALAGSDVEYTGLATRLEAFRKHRAALRRQGGDLGRDKVQKEGLELLRDLLEPIGIVYGKTIARGRTVTDLMQPIVPAHWDMGAMAANLKRQAARLRALPLEQKVPMESPEKYELEKDVRLEICQNCILFHQCQCATGHPVDWQGGGWEGHLTDQCADFKRIPIKLLH